MEWDKSCGKHVYVSMIAIPSPLTMWAKLLYQYLVNPQKHIHWSTDGKKININIFLLMFKWVWLLRGGKKFVLTAQGQTSIIEHGVERQKSQAQDLFTMPPGWSCPWIYEARKRSIPTSTIIQSSRKGASLILIVGLTVAGKPQNKVHTWLHCISTIHIWKLIICVLISLMSNNQK